MGMDVYGKAPKGSSGEYFRNNVWYWHPLWDFIAEVCSDILTEDEIAEGHTNSGLVIPANKAEQIAARLEDNLKSGYAADYAKRRQAALDAQPDEPCKFCHATGTRNDAYVKGKCNGCSGTGKIRPWAERYVFDTENVQEFVQFAKESGGFEID